MNCLGVYPEKPYLSLGLVVYWAHLIINHVIINVLNFIKVLFWIPVYEREYISLLYI